MGQVPQNNSSGEARTGKVNDSPEPSFLNYFSAALAANAFGWIGLIAVAYYWNRRLCARFDDARDEDHSLLETVDEALKDISTEIRELRLETGKLRLIYGSLEKALDGLAQRLLADDLEDDVPVESSAPPQGAPLSPPLAEPFAAPEGPPSEIPQTLNDDAIPPAGEPLRQRLGKEFLREVQSAARHDSAHFWEAFVARLRTIYKHVESLQVCWDLTASPRFFDRSSDDFKDTGKCWLLRVDSESLLFFPKLLESARSNDLPGCRISPPGILVLKVENLAEFLPPKVQHSADGWIIFEEGEVKYCR